MTENQRNDYENELIDLLVYMKGYPNEYTLKHLNRAKRLMTLLSMR